MHQEALEKVIHIAQKNPQILLSPTFFEKICTRLDIETYKTNDRMTFRFGNREAQTAIINPQNCRHYKCIVSEGKNGIMIYEFINVLITLLTDEDIPPSPHDKMGPTSTFYCERGIGILQNIFLHHV